MPVPLVIVACAVPLVVGVLVLRRRQVIGWLLVLHGACVGLLAPGWPAGTGHAAVVADQLSAGAWPLMFLWLALIGYLLPTGVAPSAFWQRWIRVGLVGVVAFLVGAAGDADGFRQTHHGAALPLRWLPPGPSAVLGVTGLLAVLLLLFASPVAVALRLRRAWGEERLQLLWLVWGAATVPLPLLAGWTEYFLLGERLQWAFWAALTVSSITLPAAIGVAILRHRLFDIELVLSRTLTYGLLTVAVLAVYGGLLALTGRVFPTTSAAGLASVAVVAVTVQPVHSSVHRLVERWVYGLRSEPHLALRRLVDRADAADPTDLLAAAADTISEALRADEVRVAGPGAGVPLVHRGTYVGDLVIRLPRGRTLSAADESLLRDLTRYAALLVSSAQLYDEVRDSRTRIVSSREEERRRLRRDLHDGLGPSLAAVVLKLNAIQSTSAEPDLRSRLLIEVKDEVKGAIAEVRRLVDDLRPPAVDEVGLLQALRYRAAALSGDVAVHVDGPDGLRPLPAAVETAAFRIASEAMTNAVRHSGASRCRVTLTAHDALEMTITDNGRGLSRTSARDEGVGLTSMRERALEIGGSCTVTSGDGGGVRVRAVLPLPQVGSPAAAAEASA